MWFEVLFQKIYENIFLSDPIISSHLFETKSNFTLKSYFFRLLHPMFDYVEIYNIEEGLSVNNI